MIYLEWRDRMNPFASYRAINTKLHAKKRILLSKNEWHKIAQYQEVSEVIGFLKKRTGYKEQMALYPSSDLHRLDLEVILDRYCVEEIETMLHYFSGSYKEFFKTFLMEYEISDLCLILRTISREDELKDIAKLFVHSEKWGLAQYHKLIGCKNVAQFVEALRGTCYYSALKTMSVDDMVKREFHMEMKLYVLFYNELIEKASRLKPKDALLAKKMIGVKIDFINAGWIYRALKYYDISPEEILIYSLPNGDKLSYSKLKKLSYSKNIEDYKMQVEKYLRYPLFKMKNDVFLDAMTDRYLYQFACHMDQDDESIASSIAYISLLGIEVNDLITLTEGIRYKLGEGDLSRYLVHTI